MADAVKSGAAATTAQEVMPPVGRPSATGTTLAVRTAEMERVDEITRKLEYCILDSTRRMDEAQDTLERVRTSLLRMEHAARASGPPTK